VVFIADAATAQAIAQVLTNLDRPKPQVLIKVVFLEVTHTDDSDIGIEGTFNKSIGSSPSSLVTNYSVVNNAIVPTSITGGNNLPFASAANTFGQPGTSSAFGGANGLYQILGQDFTVTLRAIAQAGNRKCCRGLPSSPATTSRPPLPSASQFLDHRRHL